MKKDLVMMNLFCRSKMIFSRLNANILKAQGLNETAASV